MNKSALLFLSLSANSLFAMQLPRQEMAASSSDQMNSATTQMAALMVAAPATLEGLSIIYKDNAWHYNYENNNDKVPVDRLIALSLENPSKVTAYYIGVPLVMARNLALHI